VKPSIVPAELEAASAAPAGLLESFARKLLCAQLRRLRHGEIRLLDGGSEERFGTRTERCQLSVAIEVLHPRFYSEAVFGGTVGAGAAYIRGRWRCSDLTDLTRIMCVNRAFMDELDSRWTFLTQPLLRVFHWLHGNSETGSERNIGAHYDLGNDFYRLMLDETMAYSCGIFRDETTTLADASRAKFDAVCKALALEPADHLLEIGTGWGGLAIHAARNYGCRVTTTTISRAQHDYAREQIERAGLADRVTLLFEDYRNLSGQYDKLASVEMVEAVGAPYLDTYLAKCAALLRNTGAMLLRRSPSRTSTTTRSCAASISSSATYFPAASSPRSAPSPIRSAGSPTSRSSTCRTSARITRARWRCGARISSSTSPRCASSDSTTTSCACGSSTCAAARARLRNARSAMRRYC